MRPDATQPRSRAIRTLARPSPRVISAVALAGLVAVGAGLRFWGVGANRLGYDEAFTAMAGRKSLGDMLCT